MPDGLEGFLATLDPERASAARRLREIFAANVDDAIAERASAKGIEYYVSHSVFPAGYHCSPKDPLPYAQIVASKTGLTLHFFAVYADGDTHLWLRDEFEKAGKKLDMGAACIRFKKVTDIPFEVVEALVVRIPGRNFIDRYVSAIDARSKKR